MSKKSQKTNLKKAASNPASQPASRSTTRAGIKPASKSASKNIYWMLGALALIAVLITGGVLLSQNTSGAATAAMPKEISVQEAYAMRQDGAFILDVRQPEEWEEYHIPGSTLIPLGELETRLDEVPKDKEIVVVCRSGNRSQQGRDILASAGFTQVTSMAGGLKDWRSSGYETVSGP
jgi:rhodanese-related sulfurtransferase